MRHLSIRSALVAAAVAGTACASGGNDGGMRVVGGPPVGDYVMVDPVTTPAEIRIDFDGFGYVLRRNARELERGTYRATGNRMSMVPEAGRCAGATSFWTWTWRDERLTLNFFDGRCPALLQARGRIVLERR